MRLIGRRGAQRLLRHRARAAAIAAAVFALALLAHAQEVVVNFYPSTTQVAFTLGATLHTVHGTFKLKGGQIHFDPTTGKAGGSVILDATSGNTDNASRDKKMHGEILESAKFPEIAFTPSHVTGPVSDALAGKNAQLQITGIFRLHGEDHAMTIPVTVAPDPAAAQTGRLQATTKFDVPYIAWGLKNPSTFVLRVSDTVNLEIRSTIQISRASASR